MKLEIGPEDTFTVAGMRGTGKTTLMNAFLGPRTIVWDPLAQYDPKHAYRPRSLTRAEFDELAGRLWYDAPVRLLVEEAEQVLPQGPDLPPNFKSFALMGRNLGLSWGMNTRQPAALTKKVLDESDHIFIFKLGGRALDYMVAYLGKEGRRLEEMRSWVKDPRQGGGRFFWYHDGELEECPPLRLPKPRKL